MYPAQQTTQPSLSLRFTAAPKTIWLAFGGNQGDVLATFADALAAIVEHLGGHWQAISSLYQTSPLQLASDKTSVAPYWNMACQLESSCSLLQCWDYCQLLERRAGRRSGSLWAPRPLDIDVLWVEPVQACVPELDLPHPRLHERGFVLAPMVEIAPNLRLPTFDCSIETLWQRLPASQQKMLGRLPPLVPSRKKHQAIVGKSALD